MIVGNVDGLTVLLTRAREDAEVWAHRLAARGGRAVVFPCIEGRPIRDEATVAKLVAVLGDADWLVVSSVRGVRGVAALAGPQSVVRVSIAAVGRTTADAAERELGHVDLIGADGTARTLAESLADRLADADPRSIRIPNGRGASRGAARGHRQHGRRRHLPGEPFGGRRPVGAGPRS